LEEKKKDAEKQKEEKEVAMKIAMGVSAQNSINDAVTFADLDAFGKAKMNPHRNSLTSANGLSGPTPGLNPSFGMGMGMSMGMGMGVSAPNAMGNGMAMGGQQNNMYNTTGSGSMNNTGYGMGTMGGGMQPQGMEMNQGNGYMNNMNPQMQQGNMMYPNQNGMMGGQMQMQPGQQQPMMANNAGFPMNNGFNQQFPGASQSQQPFGF